MAGGLGVSGHSQGRAASPDWEGIQASDGSTALGRALLEPEDGGRELEVWCGGARATSEGTTWEVRAQCGSSGLGFDGEQKRFLTVGVEKREGLS